MSLTSSIVRGSLRKAGTLFLVVVPVGLVLLVHQTSGQGFEPILQQCCATGESWALNHTTCTGPPEYQRTNRQSCLTSLYVCCVKAHRKIACENGKNAARNKGSCSALPGHGGITYKDCCDACALGIQANERRISCSFTQFSFGSPWDEAYQDCCHTPSIVQIHDEFDTLSCQDRHCAQLCEESGTSTRCSCHSGYRLESDLKNCVDIDECQSPFPNPCNLSTEVCINTPGRFQCQERSGGRRISQCPEGYDFNYERRTCDDVDECQLNPCRQNEDCVNTKGSYTCTVRNSPVTCPRGFVLQRGIERCIDVDECAEGTDRCDKNIQICQNSHGSYQCLRRPSGRDRQNCPAGFKWDDQDQVCEDINECSEGTHMCDSTQDCVNDIGSFRCKPRVSCPFGYRFDAIRRNCDDINECLERTDDCDRRSEVCINTAGSYQCQSTRRPRVNCGVGYVFDIQSDTCVDLDECDVYRPCHSEQICENSQGSYRCICQQGFLKDTATGECKDVNECQLHLHDCSVNQRCDNTPGSYACIRLTGCGTGYTLNAASSHCEDDDECVLGNHNCGPGFECRNTEGSFRCDRVHCPHGQKLLTDGTCRLIVCGTGMEHDDQGNCIDINECAVGQRCRQNQRCINTAGSFVCQNLLTCPAGYELNEAGDACDDVNECTRQLHECGSDQSCKNRDGGYVCECPRGYTLNSQRQCEDVDECTRFRGQICASNSECINTQGSYICNCKDGFKAGATNKTCEDVDECAETPNICDHTCHNNWGSYQCSCRLGYTLNPDERTCDDLNECEAYGGIGSLCIGFCVNEPGSYKCTCPSGYRLSTDGRTCQDIDECQEDGVCKGSNSTCLNTRGGYKCNHISCPTNYVRDKDHRNRCKRSQNCNQRTPQGASECLRDPLSFSYNYITFVSNMRLPLSGHLDLFTMRGPRFQSTSVQFDLELVEAKVLKQGVGPQVTEDYFRLKKNGYNEAIISLVKTIEGPQELQLDLVMKMFHNGLFGGTAVAQIYIYVTEYEF